jgi:hypothetical protein
MSATASLSLTRVSDLWEVVDPLRVDTLSPQPLVFREWLCAITKDSFSTHSSEHQVIVISGMVLPESDELAPLEAEQSWDFVVTGDWDRLWKFILNSFPHPSNYHRSKANQLGSKPDARKWRMLGIVSHSSTCLTTASSPRLISSIIQTAPPISPILSREAGGKTYLRSCQSLSMRHEAAIHVNNGNYVDS